MVQVDTLKKVKILEQLNGNVNSNSLVDIVVDDDDHQDTVLVENTTSTTAQNIKHDRTDHQRQDEQQLHESDTKINSPLSSPTSNLPINHPDSNATMQQQQQQQQEEENETVHVDTTLPDISNHDGPTTGTGIVPPSQPPTSLPPPQQIKLIKSTRLKGYMTLTLAAFINYDAARTSNHIDINTLSVVPSTNEQRIYAQITSIISLIGTCICCMIHFDRISTLQNKIWIPLFKNGSKYEGCIVVFYTIWWTIATGIATSVTGIAGDGKGQYSLYYSTWACCLTSYWILERWCVAAGWVCIFTFYMFFEHT
jgi:hypothetical protein